MDDVLERAEETLAAGRELGFDASDPDYALIEALAAQARVEDLLAARAMDDEQFRKDRARIDELERMVVWAVRHGAEVEGDRMWWFRMLCEDSGDVDTECDGTPASILEAVAKAMKG